MFHSIQMPLDMEKFWMKKFTKISLNIPTIWVKLDSINQSIGIGTYFYILINVKFIGMPSRTSPPKAQANKYQYNESSR